MTKPVLDLPALVEKSADADLLLEMIGFAAQRRKIIVRKFLIVGAADTRFTRRVMIEGIAPGESLDWLCEQYLRG